MLEVKYLQPQGTDMVDVILQIWLMQICFILIHVLNKVMHQFFFYLNKNVNIGLKSIACYA